MFLIANRVYCIHWIASTIKKIQSNISIFIDIQEIGWICSIEGLYKIRLIKERFQRLFWEAPNTLEQPNLVSSRSIVKDKKSGTFMQMLDNASGLTMAIAAKNCFAEGRL